MDKLWIGKPAKTDLTAAYHVFQVTIPDALLKEGIELPAEFIFKEIELKKHLLDTSLDRKNISFLIAKMDDIVIGTISFGPCGEDIKKCTEGRLSSLGELGSLYILPQYQQQGVGSALIKEMAAELLAQGIERFCLDSGYKRAQQIWLKKFGEPYSIVKDYWAPGFDHMIWVSNTIDFI